MKKEFSHYIHKTQINKLSLGQTSVDSGLVNQSIANRDFCSGINDKRISHGSRCVGREKIIGVAALRDTVSLCVDWSLQPHQHLSKMVHDQINKNINI